MKSYSERVIFTPLQVELWVRAAELVSDVDVDSLPLTEEYKDKHGNPELRCHELARAVLLRLCLETTGPGLTMDWSDRFEAVDGAYGTLDHTWLELDQVKTGERTGRVILDVYAVGRLPQVQLLDVLSFGPKNGLQYRRGTPRKDISHRVVKCLLDQWAAKYDKLSVRTMTKARAQ